MRRTLLITLLALPGMLAPGRPALAWGTATHAFIAEAIADDFVPGPRVFRPYMERQFAYGAMAPDLAWIAPVPLQPGLGQATHLAPGYDDVFDLGQPDRAATVSFALGWLTHNEVWGADRWAHDSSDGYVAGKALALAWQGGIPEDLAHDYIEIALDLLIDHQHAPAIGDHLREAALGRTWRIPGLLADSYPGFDAGALTDAERTFRKAMIAYGVGLSLPSPYDDDAAAFGLAIHAQSAYDIDLSFGQSKALLIEATNLVRDDYWPALDNAINQTRLGLWGWLAFH